MHTENGHVHLDEEEASGGSKEGVVRYVLMGGLLLAVILMSVVWIVPAVMRADDKPVGVPDPTSKSDKTTHQDGLDVVKN